MNHPQNQRDLEEEITHLEARLLAARAKLPSPVHSPPPLPQLDPPPHPLLLLSDSALPLGSFAFSNGLESYLAHHRLSPNPHTLQTFLSLSLTSLATTTLPYLRATHTHPTTLPALDATQDASTLCPVTRRASLAQGLALLAIWDRAFKSASGGSAAADALAGFSGALKIASAAALNDSDQQDFGTEYEGEYPPCGHFAPLFGTVARAMELPLMQAAYIYLFNHAKAVVSAAVRASVLGPYAAQGVLAGGWLREELARCLQEGWRIEEVEETGQGVPVLELWQGRHEVLYSRIFNS